MAAAILHPRKSCAIGTVSIAGPSFRMTPARIVELAPALLTAAAELSQASIGSEFLSETIRATATTAKRSGR
jgi:DNA-binding IclR family transcriptional regulator